MATTHELATLASQARHVLIDFDGPVCDIFSGLPNHAVADELHGELLAAGIDVPEQVARIGDPLKVFRARRRPRRAGRNARPGSADRPGDPGRPGCHARTRISRADQDGSRDGPVGHGSDKQLRGSGRCLPVPA
jgi:hypothetical protein